jgi:hypothetical protein
MVDADIDIDATGEPIAEELARNDATRIGDVEVYQAPPTPIAQVTEDSTWYGPWPGDWPWPVPQPGEALPPEEGPPPEGGAPELAIAKTAPAECAFFGVCTFTLTVTNNGPGAYGGPLTVVDAPPGFAALLVGWSPDWTCLQPEAGSTIGCRHEPVTLAPGASIALEVAVEIPAPEFMPAGEAELWNCGFILWPMALTGEQQIRAVQGELALQGYFPGLVNGVLTPETQAAISAYRAAHGLPPGGIDDALLASLYPGSAGMVGDANPDNDWACAPIQLVPAGPEEHELILPDLRVEKVDRPGDCIVGDSCTFMVIIHNEGSTVFTGPIVISDVAEVLGFATLPADHITALSPGWTCVPIPPARCGSGGVLILSAWCLDILLF